MASKSGQRVRLVKCPKCLKILQEDEDVPVYQCGGCSAILQAKRRSTAPKTAPSAGEAERAQASESSNTAPSAGETKGAQASELPSTPPSAGEAERDQASESPNAATSGGEAEGVQASESPNAAPSAGEAEGAQASEHLNTATSGGEAEGVQASESPNAAPSEGEAEGAQASEHLNTATSAGEAEGGQASEPPSEPETNNVSSSSGQDTVLASPSGQEDEKDQDGSMESTEKQLDGLELSQGEERNEIQLRELSLGDSDKNEEEDNSSRLKSDMKSVAGTSSGSLNDDPVMEARRTSDSSSDAFHKLEAEISPDASPIEEEQQDQEDHLFQPHRDSTDDLPANKTSSAYDGSKSSSDEREDQEENQQWNALQNIRYPQTFKEQGGSSSSTFSDKRPSGTTTHKERHQYKSLQLEGPGGRLGRQGRRHVSEQLRPDVPLYPREPYARLSPSSYPSHDVFDRYSRAHSLQMPPPYEGVDHMYHNNNTRARERGQGSRFSGEMTNHPGWYSSQMYSSYSSYSASPQRLMEQQPEYYPRWSHEIVSDAEDHQRTRHEARLRRQQPVAKRHIRPTAGGAPFVSCYSCSANLQLPVDFLIFKRKYHLLRCGTCTTVLRFSLQSRTHLVPAVTHDINANRSSNPENPSSSAAQEEEEEEEIPVARGSPLHRLMGYSTVSQVFKASQRPPSV
ncbi:protein ENHANCED DISEASE RESISTANCE 4 [Brassica rapa]|uniref:protein ENHANCED DISEASE RESISTANCE 4 n=1 Tax=Brassica campestris TaxID=3711 RepID=UPI00142DD4AE|nr:protein ENHANCED DISEASE RESISTANCE 4 [Brassica rapa]XP_009130875.2 protein ENHANCED DISEASE RESISTANCE 4 [Brassica rapa]XP_018513232.2 protein ENHANCED DISEASE RESISTANCE 4 [Brassica rapa]